MSGLVADDLPGLNSTLERQDEPSKIATEGMNNDI